MKNQQARHEIVCRKAVIYLIRRAGVIDDLQDPGQGRAVQLHQQPDQFFGVCTNPGIGDSSEFLQQTLDAIAGRAEIFFLWHEKIARR